LKDHATLDDQPQLLAGDTASQQIELLLDPPS
jgi:hypothetical protein